VCGAYDWPLLRCCSKCCSGGSPPSRVQKVDRCKTDASSRPESISLVARLLECWKRPCKLQASLLTHSCTLVPFCRGFDCALTSPGTAISDLVSNQDHLPPTSFHPLDFVPFLFPFHVKFTRSPSPFCLSSGSGVRFDHGTLTPSLETGPKSRTTARSPLERRQSSLDSDPIYRIEI
jgi:hypothetical protein